ncbi:hypothetical protein N665_1633s0003 [Sinapis alba]|nr:hypothetical protein N665_1633s0003 [Sinapis alba]
MEPSRASVFSTEGIKTNEAALPHLMFAEGEELVGVRVLTYQSSRSINTILDALEEEAIQYLRGTSFGKIVEIAEKPGFSGRFARYLLSRQLKVEKKHEAWFRFAGKPIRFSIREFAIVTGLPCGEIPQNQKLKKKKNMKEKLYWPELFGNIEHMRVYKAVKMLRRKTVTDKDTRLKLACLAIVSSVLLSTNLKMKMLKEHAQLLGDIEEFLAFPWGRLAFDMLMDSIKKCDEVSLSKNTIALKGLALQLVIIEAVPSLTEVVQESCSSSESDSGEEDNDSIRIKTKKQTLSPAHGREVDKKVEAFVRCIIPMDPQHRFDESILLRSDEVSDSKVDNLLKLINVNHFFVKFMFTGGLTKLDVDRLRLKENVAVKRKQPLTNQPSSVSVDEAKIIALVESTIQLDITRIDGQLESIRKSVESESRFAELHKADVLAAVDSMLLSFKNDIIAIVSKATAFVISRNSRPPRDDANDEIINNVIESLSEYSTPPPSGQACPVMDILIRLVRSTVNKQAGCKTGRNCQFLDARFASMLARCYPKFKKAKSKKDYIFSKGIVGCLSTPTPQQNMPTRFYFPFNVDNRHWIGLCIYCPASKIYVLDCNVTARSDDALASELRTITDIFIHLLKFSGCITSIDGITLLVDRVEGVAQNTIPADAGLTAALLMQTHALFGADTCRCITPIVLTEEAQRDAVMIYEFKHVL